MSALTDVETGAEHVLYRSKLLGDPITNQIMVSSLAKMKL